ncbi:MAG: Tol-Pal system beta propeller repeat protein TolB [Proteobacteria bacterium]|nr:Tol-Pal system beta propeller repeat protein TolB [Pseudomonadota bacterium]MDA1136093.1 Tol-Pal system beta propeller repeat protein TolB [Pseudomonadota bacterium]
MLLISLCNSEIFAEDLRIKINSGQVEPLPIAIANFTGLDAKSSEIGRQISDVITNNLVRSGQFKAVESAAFIAPPTSPSVRPNFSDWTPLGIKALISGSAKAINENQMEIEFRLWDVIAETDLVGLRLSVDSNSWRRVAHIISDEIFQRLSGDTGYFDTRIVYVAESGLQNKRVKRLAIMDQDGENHQYLTDGSFLVLTPRFSPTSQEITYLAYYKNEPRVYIFNLETGQQELLGSFPGMTFAPRFSPSGDKIIMSLADKGVTDIYEMNLNTQEVIRLTNSSSIDTSPSYSPDSSKIVFNSDRGGSQQLYIMDKNGAKVKRISYGEGRYATPVWAPKGELIAFTKMLKNKFYIGVMAPDGSGERLLAEGYLVEGPTWAPNGRVLMYFKQDAPVDNDKSSNVNLYKVDITGFREERILTPSDGSDPAWSPLLNN